jgi:hypothetical protein
MANKGLNSADRMVVLVISFPSDRLNTMQHVSMLHRASVSDRKGDGSLQLMQPGAAQRINITAIALH